MALSPVIAEKAYLDVNASVVAPRRAKELNAMRDAEEAMDKLITSGMYENEITYTFPCYISDEATVEFMDRYRKVGWKARSWGTNCMCPVVAIYRLPEENERVSVPTRSSSESTDSPRVLYVDVSLPVPKAIRETVLSTKPRQVVVGFSGEVEGCPECYASPSGTCYGHGHY